MFGTTTCHQPLGIHVERFGYLEQEECRDGYSSAAGNDARHCPFSFSQVVFDVSVGDLPRLADHLNSRRDTVTQVERLLTGRVSVWVPGICTDCHHTDGGHVTTRNPAERVISGSALHFSRQLPNLSKEFRHDCD